LLFFVGVVAVLAIRTPRYAPENLNAPAINSEVIELVNSNPRSTWKAGVNKRFIGMTVKDAKRQMGVLDGGPKLPVRSYNLTANVPDSYDVRTQWKGKCPSTDEVRDQANCGSCWAFGAVESMTDRICIASAGAKKPHLSAEDMNSCCAFCGNGCGGGYPQAAWQYWEQTGLVTGGNYNGGLCYPYSLKPCDHHVPGPKGPCQGEGPTPPCTQQCQNGADWQGDKHMGGQPYSLNQVADIQNDIMTYGPVEGAFDVFEDFLQYRTGVYSHQQGGFLGGHAIKILGWGVWTDGTPYWTIANSWNEDWGNKGYFLMKRGSDECGIEDGVVAGQAPTA